MVPIAEKIDYAVSGALGQDELGALLQAAAGSTYTATELEKVIAHSTAYVTARDGKRLVGFGRLFSDGAVVAYLNNLAVEPSYRRLGIGKAILTALIAAAGNKEVFLLLPVLLVAHGIGVFAGSKNATKINQTLLKRIVAVASIAIACIKLFL